MDIFAELKQHSISDILSMGTAFIRTRLFFPKALLIRRPFHFRGKKSAFQYTKGFTTGRNCRIEIFKDGVIELGENCRIGDNVHIAASERITIGKECLFASKIFISDTSHGKYSGEGQTPPDMPPDSRELFATPVEIGDNVWLGENVVVLAGVRIGSGSIIGANSTVTRDIPDNCIAAGTPAKPLKLFDSVSGRWEKA